MTAAEDATVRDAIKTDPSAVQLPQFDKLRLILFSGQVPLDSRYRKVSVTIVVLEFGMFTGSVGGKDGAGLGKVESAAA